MSLAASRRVAVVPLLLVGVVLAGCGSRGAVSTPTTLSVPQATSSAPPTTPAPTMTTAPPTTAATATTTITAPASTSTTTPPTTTPPTTTPPTTTPPTSTSTTTTVPPATLQLGDTGPAVTRLQERLTSLGYWVGTTDGVFGDSTQQAVFALQKAAGLTRDGVVGPHTAAALRQGIVPHPRSTSGYVVEVDLSNDLLLMVDDGHLEHVLNTSTGGGYTYTSDGVTAVADTPTGHFQVFRQVDGMVTDSLGQLWRPKFFYSGFAIHGDSYVPAEPVSHGCVRVSDEAIDWIWADDLLPMGTNVWVY